MHCPIPADTAASLSDSTIVVSALERERERDMAKRGMIDLMSLIMFGKQETVDYKKHHLLARIVAI